MVISQDGVNFDPADPANRQVRIVASSPGPQSVTWDGLTNAGVPFPVGGPYPVKIDGHAGEYHFPMLDVENNLVGGPVITLLNPPGGVCPPWNGGCRGAFYDDRGYVSGNGTAVGTPGQVLCAGLGRVATRRSATPCTGSTRRRLSAASATRPAATPTCRAHPTAPSATRRESTSGRSIRAARRRRRSTSSPTRRPSSTSASSPSGIKVGQTVTVTDTAQLSGFNNLAATAEVEFSLVGPVADRERMSNRARRPESGQRSRRSADRDGARSDLGRSRRRHPATTTGWRASSGDPGNLPAGPVGCGDPAELVTVAQATPTLSTQITVISTRRLPVSPSSPRTPRRSRAPAICSPAER